MEKVDLSNLPFDENEVRFDRFVSVYFRITLFISATFMFLGYILYYSGPATSIDLENLTFSIILGEISKFSPVGIMFIGIIILLLIPVGRVVILIFHHLSEKDMALTVISMIVLCFIFIGIIFDIK